MRVAASPARPPAASPDRARREDAGNQITVAAFNVENFFPPGQNKDARVPVTPLQYEIKLKKLERAIRDELHTPDLISLEEVGSQKSLDDLISQTGLGTLGYKTVMLPTNDRRGINVALMYNSKRITVDSARQVNTPTPANTVPGSPSGSVDPSLLFARPPLVVDVSLRGAAQAVEGVGQLELVLNHFVAKLGGPKTDPRRNAQGAFIGGLIDAARAAVPNRGVIALGDFNTNPGEAAFTAITTGPGGAKRVTDAPELKLKPAERYTYKYHGAPDMLDHMFVTPDLAKTLTSVVIPHFDSDDNDQHTNDASVANGVSDHDPILATFTLPTPAAAAAPTTRAKRSAPPRS